MYYSEAKVSFVVLLIIVLIFTNCTNRRKQNEHSLLDFGIPLKMAEYRKKQVSEVVYEMEFNIPESLEESIPATLNLSLNISDLTQPLYLDFNEDKNHLLSVHSNDRELKITHEKEHLLIPSEHLQKGLNQIKIEFIAGELSLNRNEDFLYTLLVPDRASTLFPCFDQPDIKANYILTIKAPKEWKVLCGAPLKERTETGDFATHYFSETEKMSTYLFSFVAGNFNTSSLSPNNFKMNMLFRENEEERIKASEEEIFKLHKQSVDFLEEYTGYEFPFQKLDFATIPGFQYGGMEHVGAIQYRESSLFLDGNATENQKLRRAKLIAHETAHMWFGDLVTMKWFNDVWMKEVFANFMADKIANPAFPQFNHNLQFLTTHYPSAYSEDRTKGTNPIRQKLDNLKNAGSVYGRIIYNKAPIMMRQLEQIMGEDRFQKGIQEYIKAYANENADWPELVELLDKNTGIDLKKWSEVWVNQSGRPIITENVQYENGKIKSWSINQKAEDGSGKLWPQVFQVGLVYPDSIHKIEISISGSETVIEEAQGLNKPGKIIYNYNGYGYGIFPVKEKDLKSISEIENEVARAHSYLNAYENVLSGNIKIIKLFETLNHGVLSEKNELILQLVSGEIQNIFWKYLTIEERDTFQKELEHELFEYLTIEKPTNIQKTLFNLYRGIAYAKTGQDRLYKIWAKELDIPNLNLNQNDYSDIALDLSVYGHSKAGEVIESQKKEISNPDRLARFEFLLPAVSKNESIRDSLFLSFKDSENRAKESWVQAANNYIHHPLRQRSASKHIKLSLELLEEIQKTGDIFFPKGWLNSTIGNYASKEAHKAVEEYLETHPNLNESLKNKLLQVVDDLYRIQLVLAHKDP